MHLSSLCRSPFALVLLDQPSLHSIPASQSFCPEKLVICEKLKQVKDRLEETVYQPL